MINTKQLIVSLYNKYRNFILYGFFGSAAAVIDYLVYTLLLYLNVFSLPEICSVIGNVCGFIFTFTTNTFLNFKKKDAFFRRFISYAAICIAGSAVSTLLIYIFKDIVNLYILKIAVMVIICIAQYLLNKIITYKD